MAKDLGAFKFDANTEAFQMRAQWKKVALCRQMWNDRWSWLLDERNQALAEAQAARAQYGSAMPHQAAAQMQSTKSLKPVPRTVTGTIGWLASKPDCQLEIYTSWLTKIPRKLPEAWENKNYFEKKPI